MRNPWFVPSRFLESSMRLLAAAAVAAISMSGCSDTDGVTRSPVSLAVTAPQVVEVDELVRFIVTASSSRDTITASRIDFDGDGTWDETRSHGVSVVLTTYQHVYPSTASYTASVEILEDGRTLAAKSNTVRVDPPTLQREVWLRAESVGGGGHRCVVTGLPAIPQGQPALSRTSVDMGLFDRGATVDFTQSFLQQCVPPYTPYYPYYPYYSGPVDSCVFSVKLYSLKPPSQWASAIEFASGTCTAGDDPFVAGECTVTVQGVVP